ncbi:hypothetical protein H311_03067 [Anncaliia algerae PRA109]|nr:hypothetical protein H311_03067 [Anncaliia algerae PRA109]
MSSDREIIYNLLTKGYSKQITSISSLNKKLLIMKYEAVMWYDKSCIILKDNSSEELNDNPISFLKVKFIINGIINNKLNDFCNDTMKYLIKNNWVEKINEDYFITKRFMVQYEEYILNNYEFNKCKYCDFVVKGKEYHEYCENKYLGGYKKTEINI